MNSHRALCVTLLSLAGFSIPAKASEVALIPEQSMELSLAEAIDTALEQNLGLRSALFEPVVAEAATAQAASRFETQLFGSASYSGDEQDSLGTANDRQNFAAGVRREWGTGTQTTLQTSSSRSDGSRFSPDLNERVGGQLNYSADLELSVRQPLWKGRGSTVTRSELRQAQLGEAVIALEVRGDILDVIAATERAYWNAVSARLVRDLRAASLRAADSLLSETAKREELGLVTRIEVLQARAALAARHDDVLVAQGVLDDAEDGLLRQLGLLRPDTSPEEELVLDALPEDELRQVNDWDSVWLASLESDPTFVARQLQVEQRQEQRRRAADATRPELDAVASVGVSGLDSREAREAYRDALNQDGHSWSVGVEFSMPFGFKAERARLREADARVEQSELAVLDRQQALLNEVRSAWRSVQTAEQRLDSTAASLEFQEATYEQELARRDNGLATTREVLEAQRDLDAARLTDLGARVDLILARLSLARLDGTLLERHDLIWDQLTLSETF